MAKRFIAPARRVVGEYEPPGDKSISHRLAILGSLGRGPTRIEHACPGEDFRATLRCLQTLGVELRWNGTTVDIEGQGLYAFRDTSEVLDAGNSGTTLRLLAGVLAAQPFTACLTGDDSLRNRPMRRIIYPLSLMGAEIEARKGNYPPVIIRGGPLRPIRYVLPVTSAQVKSAILLAGLYVRGITEVIEPFPSRNHTERLMREMGVAIAWQDGVIRIQGGRHLQTAERYQVPGDLSSAAFFIVAAAILPDSDLVVRNVNLNPTRTGLLDVLQAMGGHVEILRQDEVHGEPVGDLRIRPRPLRGTTVTRVLIGRLIDELPLIALLGAHAEGQTMVRHAKDLRVKESDRIRSIVENFRRLGIEITERMDGFVIEGPQTIRGGTVSTFQDHRVAMTFSIAGLVSQQGVTLDNDACVAVSYPDFFHDLARIVET